MTLSLFAHETRCTAKNNVNLPWVHQTHVCRLPTMVWLFVAFCIFGTFNVLVQVTMTHSRANKGGAYLFNEQCTLAVHPDYGAERSVALNGGTAKWNGAAVYLRFNATKHVSLTLRGEQFEDRGGARTGIAQKLREFTLTPEYRPADGLVLRGDLRLDTSSEKVFEKQGGTADTQFTICANVLFIF